MQIQRPDHRSASAGFGLLELLVSLALVGLVTAIIAQSFSFGARVWEREAARGTDLDLAAMRLTAMLEGAVLPTVRAADFSVRVPFAGSERGLTFLSHAGGIGLEQWSLETRVTPQGWTLTGNRRAVSGPEAADDQRGGAEAFAFNGLDAVSFAFAGDAPFGATAPWTTVWPSGPRAPRLVRIRIERGRRVRTSVARLRAVP